jgi:hypothetical protein
MKLHFSSFFSKSEVHFSVYRVMSVLATATVVKWSEFLATDPDVRVRFSALPDFVRSNGSGTRSTQPRERN